MKDKHDGAEKAGLSQRNEVVVTSVVTPRTSNCQGLPSSGKQTTSSKISKYEESFTCGQHDFVDFVCVRACVCETSFALEG